MMRSATILLPTFLALLALTGCKNHIGDGCGNSTDCSVTGDRQCDLSQPGGYCTIFSCDADTCPEGACVEWRFIPSRTAETWCMKTCGSTADCGRREYSCVFPNSITQDGKYDPNLPLEARVARIIDLDRARAESKICVALDEGSDPEAPASEAEADAGM